MPKPFASSTDLDEKKATLEQLAEGVYAFTAQGDPNVGAIVGADTILAIEARATPFMARRWIEVLRAEVSDLMFGDLVLTHYHAVRTLGARAFGATRIIAHENTRALVDERGIEDWASEQGRMPRLFAGAESIPGLTHPTLTFTDSLTLDLGNRHVELRHLGQGHTSGDIVVWLPEERILFAGDLVEAEAAPYMGDSYPGAWSTGTLDAVVALEARQLVGGRGAAVRDDAVGAAIEDTRAFIRTTLEETREVRGAGGSLKDAFEAVHAALAPRYAGFPIFEHTMPFNVQRTWDELDGIEHPRIWTAERDRAIWNALQSM